MAASRPPERRSRSSARPSRAPARDDRRRLPHRPTAARRSTPSAARRRARSRAELLRGRRPGAAARGQDGATPTSAGTAGAGAAARAVLLGRHLPQEASRARRPAPTARFRTSAESSSGRKATAACRDEPPRGSGARDRRARPRADGSTSARRETGSSSSSRSRCAGRCSISPYFDVLELQRRAALDALPSPPFPPAISSTIGAGASGP